MPKRRGYSHVTKSGEFDQKAHDTAQAKEREKRGLQPFTRNERFIEVLSGAARSHEKEARQRAGEKRFTDQYDSELGRRRRNRRGQGYMGSKS